MAHHDALISDKVMHVVERIEAMDDPFEELDPLEVYVEAGLDGEIREVYVVLAVGGPDIDVALYDGRVDGFWRGDIHSAAVMDDEAERLLDELGDHYRDHWNSTTVA